MKITGMHVTFPSWVTLSRLILLPLALISTVTIHPGGWLTGATITALAGLTDMLDGYIARLTGRITFLGTCLDIVVDKIFICTMFVFASRHGLLPLWVPGVIITREIIISLVRYTPLGTPIPTDIWGKAKTAVSYVAIIALLLLHEAKTWTMVTISGPLLSALSVFALIIVYSSVTLTLFSGANYLISAGMLRFGK